MQLWRQQGDHPGAGAGAAGRICDDSEEDERTLEVLQECAWEDASPGTKPSVFWFCEERAGERGQQFQALVAFRKGRRTFSRSSRGVVSGLVHKWQTCCPLCFTAPVYYITLTYFFQHQRSRCGMHCIVHTLCHHERVIYSYFCGMIFGQTP